MKKTMLQDDPLLKVHLPPLPSLMWKSNEVPDRKRFSGDILFRARE